MRLALSVALIASAAIAMPLLAQTRTSEFDSVSQTKLVDDVTQTEDVALANDGHDRMTVPVRLSGSGPYRFLVDTGADRTAVSRELARRLNLKVTGRATVHSMTGPMSVDLTTLPGLFFTSKEVRIGKVPLLDGGHMGADGILGVDSLRSQRVLFDFKAQTMAVVPSAQREARDDDGTIVIVKARERNGRLILSRAVADGVPLSMVLDTGSQLTVGNEALRRRLMRRGGEAVEQTGKVELRSVTGGKLVGDFVVVKELRIGGATLTNLAIVFADAHTFRQLKLDKKPAILFGMDAMRAFDKVSIDFANRKLRLVLPQHSNVDGTRYAARTAG